MLSRFFYGNNGNVYLHTGLPHLRLFSLPLLLQRMDGVLIQRMGRSTLANIHTHTTKAKLEVCGMACVVVCMELFSGALLPPLEYFSVNRKNKLESQVAGKRSPHENRMMSVCTTRVHLRWTYEFFLITSQRCNNKPNDQREEQGTGRLRSLVQRCFKSQR